jgi:hypothetical protein
MSLTRKDLKKIIKEAILQEYAPSDIKDLNAHRQNLADAQKFLLDGGYLEQGSEAEKGLQATIDEINLALQNLYA